MKSFTNKSLYNIFIHFVLILLCFTTYLIILQNQELKSIISKNLKKQVKSGDIYKDINVLNIYGNYETISFSENKNLTTLIIFSTTCQYCTENILYWSKLYLKFRDIYTFVAISTDDYILTQEYIAGKEIPYEVTIASEENFREVYKIAGVPQTIIVNNKGVVEEVWLGSLDENSLNEIHNFLDDRAIF